MNAAESFHLYELLHSRRDTIAEHWYGAIASTSISPLSEPEVRSRFRTLTDHVITLLLTERFERRAAQMIGMDLVKLHFLHHKVVVRTHEVLAEQLMEGLSIDQIIALQPRLVTLLGEVAAGVFRQTRTLILEEQEAIRGALVAALNEVQAALNKTQRQLAQSGEAERMQIAHELHDAVIQELVVLNHQLAKLRIQIQYDADDPVGRLQNHLRQIMSDARRLCTDLRPPILDTLGLVEALRYRLRTIERDATFHIKFSVKGDDARPIPDEVALCLFRVMQEALSNIQKHAMADQIEVCLMIDTETVDLIVVDNGQGFRVPAHLNQLLRDQHFGLAGLRERLEHLNGTFELRSAPGRGTYLRARVSFTLPSTSGYGQKTSHDNFPTTP